MSVFLNNSSNYIRLLDNNSNTAYPQSQ
jgi:hypothetical protein